MAWVNAEDTGTLLGSLAAVADAAGLLDGRQDTGDPGRAVRHWLETDGDRCLIVFDDAKDPDVLRPFIPVRGRAQVLITSHRQSVANLGASVPVDVFTAEEALAFLAGRTELTDGAGAAVAAELGYLPLALAQAAAVVAGQRLEYSTYLGRLRALRVEEHMTTGEGQPYPPGVAEAVLLSMDAVRAGDRAGVCAEVMEIMAVLSATGVPRDLLQAAGHAGVLARRRRWSRVSPALVDRALARLAEQSLLTFSLDGQTVIAHRLVMHVVREGLARQGRLTEVCRAAASVLDTDAVTLVGSQDRVAVRDIPKQVAALLETAAGPAVQADDGLARVLLSLRFWALYHLNELGDSALQAIAVGEPLVADFEQLLGPDHPDTLGSRNNLALAYWAAGRFDDAIPLLELILAGRQRALGVDDPSTVASRGNLATAYREAGRAVEAIPLLMETLAGRERVLGVDHPDTLASRGNLAAIYRDVGHPADAIPLLEQIAAARERLLGADHPSSLRSRNNLAIAFRDAGRTAEAISLHEQTLAACERLLGPDHAHTLTSRNNLANAYRDAGRVAEAMPLFEQALADRERVLGPDHPHTLATQSNLALARAEARRTGLAPIPGDFG